MSDTLTTAFEAAVTSLNAQIATLQEAVAALDAKLGSVQPTGPVLSQAEVDQLTAMEAALAPIVTHVQGLAAPPAPPPAV